MAFVVEVEYDDNREDEDDKYGGVGGVFPPLPFESFSSSLLSFEVPSPCGGLEPSPSIPTVVEILIKLCVS